MKRDLFISKETHSRDPYKRPTDWNTPGVPKSPIYTKNDLWKETYSHQKRPIYKRPTHQNAPGVPKSPIYTKKDLWKKTYSYQKRPIQETDWLKHIRCSKVDFAYLHQKRHVEKDLQKRLLLALIKWPAAAGAKNRHNTSKNRHNTSKNRHNTSQNRHNT